MKTIREKIAADEYHTTLTYPSAGDPDRVAKRTAFNKDMERLKVVFKTDLFTEHDVEGPMAEAMWSKAWDLGHSYGYGDVETHFVDLVDLYEIAKKQFSPKV